MFKTTVEIMITDGQPNLWKDGTPRYWEVELELSYSIDPGQKQILYPNEKAQPGHAACVEEFEIESAVICYNKFKHHIGKDSRWMPIILEMLMEDELLHEAILQHESDLQEWGSC